MLLWWRKDIETFSALPIHVALNAIQHGNDWNNIHSPIELELFQADKADYLCVSALVVWQLACSHQLIWTQLSVWTNWSFLLLQVINLLLYNIIFPIQNVNFRCSTWQIITWSIYTISYVKRQLFKFCLGKTWHFQTISRPRRRTTKCLLLGICRKFAMFLSDPVLIAVRLL